MDKLYISREDFNTEEEYLADRKAAMEYAYKAACGWYKERPILLNNLVVEMAARHVRRASDAYEKCVSCL